MHKVILLFIAILMTGITGCASVKRNYIPEVSNLDFPEQNKETTVYLGEEMLIQGKLLEGKVLNIKQPIDGICFDIKSQTIPLVGEDSKNYYFDGIGVTRAALCDPVDGMSVPKDDLSKICVITIYGGKGCYDASLSIEKGVSTSTEYVQRNLIFSGKKGDNVEFMYVERAGNQVLLTHNVSYDISKNNIVGYRGARIKIINCSNESITYVVLQNFPDR